MAREYHFEACGNAGVEILPNGLLVRDTIPTSSRQRHLVTEIPTQLLEDIE